MGGAKKKIRIKTWQLLLILIPLLFLDATLLRFDHVRMTELRDAVFVADEANDDGAIQQSLSELQRFVVSNMVINVVDDNGNQKIMFGTGPFYLEKQYLRAATAALEQAKEELSSDSNPNGNIYAGANDVCRPLAIQNGWSWNDAEFINCMLSEIQKYPSADELQDTIIAKLPSTDLYRYNFASPIWAPTLTGFMILITLAIIVVIFIRGFIWVVLRVSLLFV